MDKVFLPSLNEMPKIALFPGSFDPITIGHVDIVRRAAPLFDSIVIGLGSNSQKSSLFTVEQRLEWIREEFSDLKSVRVEEYQGLTVNFCKQIGASYIIRGLRSAPDFEYEKNIAQFNKAMEGVDTLFFMTEPALSPISSTIVRDIIRNQGDPSAFVPDSIKRYFKK